MNTLIISLIGALALSFLVFQTQAKAQAMTQPNPATGGTVEPVPSKDAPSAPGAPSTMNAESEASGIAARIEDARKQGKDVSHAEVEEKQGEAALQAGYKAEALQHFRRAKEDLGTK
jgi:hypothetical protein